MKAKIELTLKPFTIPNYVIIERPPKPREQGVSFDDSKLALNELDEYTLAAMCDEFTRGIFEKAGKQQPPVASKD